MPSTLSVREDRQSRSKSPSGRDKGRAPSRDTRAKSPPRKEYKRSSTKYSESESESEDDRRYREKKSSTKYSESESEEDDRYKKSSSRSSKKYYEEDDRRRTKESKPSRKRDDSESESDRRKSQSKKSGRKKSESESEDDKRKSKSKQSSKKKGEAESDSSSEDISISIHRKKGSSAPTKGSKEVEPDPRRPSYGLPQPGYGYPPAPPPPGYGAPPPGYIPDPRGGYLETRHMSYVDNSDPRYAPPMNPTIHNSAPDLPRAQSYSAPGGQRYEDPQRYQYGKIDPNLVYKSRDEKPYVRGSEKQYVKPYAQNGQTQMMEITPGGNNRREKEEKKYYEAKYESREKKYHDDKYGSPPSNELTKTMSNLAVGGALGVGTLAAGRHGSFSGGKPPASPLLEAYKGTYQSISPMPSALVLANHKDDSDISDIDMSDSDNELKKKIKKLEKERQMFALQTETTMKVRETRSLSTTSERDLAIMVITPGKKPRKTVTFYDPIPDAKRISAALQGTHSPPNTKVLIQILPGLSTDDLIALRAEYKNQAKVGGQGINMAKHIKMRVTGNLGKVTYATALGRWESEAYWANSWYQGGASRRELLIESLMGRSNSDIREIKNCFKDKRYNDDLEKCMRAELKADKFRVAILLALEERRMPESALDIEIVQRDVSDLYRSLTAKEGGETAMIQIIVLRSDGHLREVLRIFEGKYNRNFARDMIGRSRNLVGETLAHILNGALNRPMRDALLLHQAIAETAPGKERAELLISRVVRLHWEPKHLERVKVEYEKRYKMPLDIAIKRQVMDAMKTEEGRAWAEFCVELVRSSS